MDGSLLRARANRLASLKFVNHALPQRLVIRRQRFEVHAELVRKVDQRPDRVAAVVQKCGIHVDLRIDDPQPPREIPCALVPLGQRNRRIVHHEHALIRS
jgi:hypothetical protein